MKNVYKFQDSRINLVLGNITKQTTDALVNTANDHLWMGEGVAGIIKRKGGKIIEQEAIAKGLVLVGDAIVTTAGKFNAKYVIPAVVIGQNLQTDENKIRMASKASLKRAEELKIESITLSALGTGIGGFFKKNVLKL